MGEGLDHDQVAALVGALRGGDAVVLPTDTVYGVAALPSVPGATERLYALKRRRPETPLAVLVADQAAARRVAAPWPLAAERITGGLWPGALTLVLHRAPEAEAWDLGGDRRSIGVRCPAQALVRAVARQVGPVAVTSANAHGQPTPPTAAEAAAALAGPVAVVADAGPRPGSASTVVDLRGPEVVVLREGPVTLDAVREAAATP